MIHPKKNYEEKKDGCCDFAVICVDRVDWWRSITIAVLVICALLGFVGFIISLVSITRSADATTQLVYPVSHTMSTAPLNHVLTGITPIILTLPNDLTPYIGKHYTIDCETGAAHQVVLTPGPLATVWMAGTMLRTATCTGGTAARSGFSFRVVSEFHVRVTEQSNVAFSS